MWNRLFRTFAVVALAEMALLVLGMQLSAALPGEAISDSALNEVVGKNCGVTPTLIAGATKKCSDAGAVAACVVDRAIGCTVATGGKSCESCTGPVVMVCWKGCPACGCSISVPCCPINSCKAKAGIIFWACDCNGPVIPGPNQLPATQTPCIP